MITQQSINRLTRLSQKTFGRFPFVCLLAIVATFMAFLMVESNRILYPKVLFTSLLALPLFLGLSLYATSHKIRPRHRWRLRIPALILLGVIFFVLPNHFDQVFLIRFVPLFLAIHLLVSFAPFTKSGFVIAFWQFNKRLFSRILLSSMSTLLMSIGFNVGIYFFGQLFYQEIDINVYIKVSILIFGIGNTLIFLYDLPDRTQHLEHDYHYPKMLRLFALYIFTPLLILYLLILYVYFVKILIQWTLPNGWVTYLVLMYAVMGILTLLLLYPIREREKWVRVLQVGFYISLLPLLGLLFASIWRRVNDYGITENRYYVAALSLWLVMLSLYFLLSKYKNIKIIPVTLFLTCFLSSFGPWGASFISIYSQKRQFQKVLKKEGMLKDGKIQVRDHNAYSLSRLNSIIQFLGERDALQKVQPFFETNFEDMWEADSTDMSKAYQVSSLLDIHPKDISTSLFSIDNSQMLDIALYDYYFHFSTTQEDYKSMIISGSNQGVVCHTNFSVANNHLLFFDHHQHLLADIKLDDFVDNIWKLSKDDNHLLTQGEMTILSQSPTFDIKIVFEKVISSKYDRKKYEVDDISAHIMITFKK